MATTPSSPTIASLMGTSDARPMSHRRDPDHRLLRAMEKVRDLISAVPEELVDRDTLQHLLMAADDGRYAVQDAERYHALWMETQDECRLLRVVNAPQMLKSGDDEPPNKTVIVDAEGDAWQREDRNDDAQRWELAGSDAENTGKTWHALTEAYGPVRVVYTPEG